MSTVAATQAEDRTLTKPTGWAVYMVIAALKCASDDELPANYASPDSARFQILKSLNWFEAHGEYAWPNFSSFHYDFSQVMRLRRALVQDVFNALKKAGSVRISVHGTPESNTGSRSADPPNRKRICRREDGISEDAMSETSDEGHGAFLLEAMANLVNQSQLELDDYMQDQDGKDPRDFANAIHDQLVEVWTKPQRETGDVSEVLRQKAEVWERHRRSQPSRPSQMERISTPRRPSGNQQVSPDDIQKPLDKSTSAPRAALDKPGGWTDANQQEQEWANTNTIG